MSYEGYTGALPMLSVLWESTQLTNDPGQKELLHWHSSNPPAGCHGWERWREGLEEP